MRDRLHVLVKLDPHARSHVSKNASELLIESVAGLAFSKLNSAVVVVV
ncbi:hypothetical protein [Undibacterium sp. RTI2.2]|nr:hypothetical protein [Undibacterium sp. RTI2.2]